MNKINSSQPDKLTVARWTGWKSPDFSFCANLWSGRNAKPQKYSMIIANYKKMKKNSFFSNFQVSGENARFLQKRIVDEFTHNCEQIDNSLRFK